MLAWGFWCRVGVMLQENALARVPPYYREISVELAEGRMRIWIETWHSPPRPGIPAGRTIRRMGSVLDFRVPKLDRAIGGFDFHSLPAGLTSGSNAFIIACPIWFLALPFCVAPLIWLRQWRERQRRLREEVAGFPVSMDR
jgi:hypothetical protein